MRFVGRLSSSSIEHASKSGAKWHGEVWWRAPRGRVNNRRHKIGVEGCEQGMEGGMYHATPKMRVPEDGNVLGAARHFCQSQGLGIHAAACCGEEWEALNAGPRAVTCGREVV